MAERPLVTVVTPTWERPFQVIRAVLSVAAQTYRPIQHVVVSDGPNPELKQLMATLTREPKEDYSLEYYELAEHPNARWGHFARLHGISKAKGNIIAYLDDDDEFLPHHIERLVPLLNGTPFSFTDFVYSMILIHEPGYDVTSGCEPPQFAGISTSSIVHYKDLLKKATWKDNGYQETIDWDIVERWMGAGAKWAFYPAVTCVAHRDGPNSSSSRLRSA